MISRLQGFRQNDGFARWERYAEWPLVGLALVFLVVLILPLAAPLTDAERHALDIANVTIWAVFVIDYSTRLYLTLDRRQFARSHILDLIVIAVPFLRPFRLLRLVAIVVSTTRRAGGLVVRQVTLYVIAVAVIVTATSAVVVYNAERDAPGSNIRSLGDALWWAITTATTVGYGDRYPVTTTGRLVAGLLMVTGIALVGTITASVAAYFVNLVRTSATADAASDATDERNQLLAEVAALRTSVEALHAKFDDLAEK